MFVPVCCTVGCREDNWRCLLGGGRQPHGTAGGLQLVYTPAHLQDLLRPATPAALLDTGDLDLLLQMLATCLVLSSFVLFNSAALEA
jgi:hypothetical protein